MCCASTTVPGGAVPCSDLEFADNAGLIATSRASAQMALKLFHTVSSAFALALTLLRRNLL